MTPKEFIRKVAFMREAQQLYFEKRDKSVLHDAKKLEREVDKAIKEINDTQKQLF